MRLIRGVLIAAVLVAGTAPAFASQLIYTPINPNFGGSPFNGAWLQSQATANNRFSAPAPSSTPVQAYTAQSFATEIENALLANVANNISTAILGSTAGASGSFNISGNIISYQNTAGAVTITIYSPTSGGSTQITIPAGS